MSLALGGTVLLNLVGEMIDDRVEYGKERVIAYGMVGVRLYVAVYTMRGDTYRIISVRKATKVEEGKWLAR